MADEVITAEAEAVAAPPEIAQTSQETAAAAAVPAAAGERKRFGGRRTRERGARRERTSRRESRERARPEFDHKTLVVRRVARVVAGGRRFNFSVALVVGNRKGSVGVGTGKAADTARALEKATRDAKKMMIYVPRTGSNSIAHELAAKYSSARVSIFPAPQKGLIAGSAVRTVLELCGITDVNAKVFSGSKNKLNMARAAIKALSQLRDTNALNERTNATNSKSVS